VTIHALPVPTPFAVGRVNCYLVDDDPLTLVDTGPNSATSLTALEAALAEHGRRVEDLGRIVITHQHIDHIGLVAILAERSGAEVCALDQLAPWLARYSEVMEGDDAFAEAIMLRHGIPEDVCFALRAVTRQFRAWGAACTVTTPLADGATLAFAERSWRVHHRPGHSPSDTIFHDEATGELLGGDHLI
jgi:glyoxylase-like metal-dependent hydrolase (beta-lactamase superfamily II)